VKVLFMQNFKRSVELFQEAKHLMPGGVSSPVRSFKAVGGTPLFIKRGSGSRIYDEDGNEFIDYVCSWGPLILGHAHPQVVEAVNRIVKDGTSFGAPTKLESTLAGMICSAVPSVELIRFVNSGTEATMSAIRLARAFTKKDKIVKFAGCYHGHSDGLLANAGSGVATLSIPASPGVPTSYTDQTLTVPYNNPEAVEQVFQSFGQDIAAVIVEPVAANMGVVPPQPGFLDHLRNLTRKFSSLLIFDEVITGFRLLYGGVQKLYGVSPDLTCFGKIIGGGLPVGAYGGSRKIMEMIAPIGSVYQAGTLSGNPVAMAAGIKTLEILGKDHVYKRLEELTSFLEQGILKTAQESGTAISISRVGSLVTFFFTSEPVTDYETACKADTGLYAVFMQRMLSQGIYLPPSQFESAFISAAHTNADIEATIDAARKSILAMS